MKPEGYKYHAFVSHAVDDKLPIANELCRRLEEAGLKIWYSGKELKVGDSLEKAILRGLDESQYGIVILSPAYVEKNWTMKEYYLLMAREIEQRKVILPVLFNITTEELLKYDIAIADKWAISFDKGMDHVIQKLLEVIRGPLEKSSLADRTSWRKLTTLIAIVLVLAFSYFTFSTLFRNRRPSPDLIENTVVKRISDLDLKIKTDHATLVSSLNAKPALMDEVSRVFTDYVNVKTNYRNAYEFRNGVKTIQSKKNLESTLRVDLDSLVPTYSYKLSSPLIFLATKVERGKTEEAHYVLMNSEPVTYSVTDEKRLDNGDYEVTVSYRNNLRYFFVELFLPNRETQLKRHHLTLKGYLPIEKYVFENRSDKWVLKDVQ